MSPQLGVDERRALAQKTRLAVLDAVRALGGEGTRAEILDRARADQRFTVEELALPAPQAEGKKPQSFVESRLHWELPSLKREGLLENPERGVWRLTEAGAKKPEPLIRVRVSLDRLTELRAMSPEEYLASPEWQRTRDVALELAGNRCSRNGRHKGQLDVHHVLRVRIGAELPGDLVVLCHDCFAEQRPRVAEVAPEEAPAAVSIAPPSLAAPPACAQPPEEAERSEPVEPAESDRSLLKRIFSRAA